MNFLISQVTIKDFFQSISRNEMIYIVIGVCTYPYLKFFFFGICLMIWIKNDELN